MNHAKMRAVERYGRQFDLAKIARIVRSGRAKFFSPGKDGCTLYDVPYGEAGQVTIVRVVMNPDNTVVKSVLPQQTAGEIARAVIKRTCDREAQRKKAFFRGFEDDANDCVTA